MASTSEINRAIRNDLSDIWNLSCHDTAFYTCDDRDGLIKTVGELVGKLNAIHEKVECVIGGYTTLDEMAETEQGAKNGRV